MNRLFLILSGLVVLLVFALACGGTLLVTPQVASTDEIVWICPSPTPVPTTVKTVFYYEIWEQENPSRGTPVAPVPAFPTPTQAVYPTLTPMPYGSGKPASPDCVDYCRASCAKGRDACDSSTGPCTDACDDARDACVARVKATDPDNAASTHCYMARDSCVNKCNSGDELAACAAGETRCKNNSGKYCGDDYTCYAPEIWEREHWQPGGGPYPSPTPEPYGEDGPVKRTVYYQEWEQEYPDQGAYTYPSIIGVFPSPTPYTVQGTDYHTGMRINLDPVNITTSVSPTDTMIDGERLYLANLEVINHTTSPISLNLALMVSIDSIETPGGAVETKEFGWRLSNESMEAVGMTMPLVEAPVGVPTSFEVPILAPDGTPQRMTTMLFPIDPDVDEDPLFITWDTEPLDPPCETSPGMITLP